MAELADSPHFREFAEAEFPEAADPSGLSRRRWLQLMGASLTLASVGGCYWDTEEIVPFVERPDGRIPGDLLSFATAMELGGSTFGLLVTSRDGRPTKIEGNANHPDSLGAAHSFAQASVLQLYDPDRSRNVIQGGAIQGGATSATANSPTSNNSASSGTAEWDQFQEFVQKHFAELQADQGKGLAFLAEPTSSLTVAAQKAKILERFPASQWIEYTPIATNQAREGSVQAFGKPYRVDFAVDRARVLLCFDCDLLGSHPASFRYARQFAQGREPSGTTGQGGHGSGPPPIILPGQHGRRMNRLYAVESRFSLTGANADHRLPLASRDMATWVRDLEAAVDRLADPGGEPSGENTSGENTSGENASGENATGEGSSFLEVVARDLYDAGKRSLVAVGPGQPPEVHAAIARINHRLGNVGTTVLYREEPAAAATGSIESLTDAMSNGQIKALVILGGNPVYDAPADCGFADAYSTVATRIHLGLYVDETARASNWHLPQSHFLESWGDGRAFDGTYTLQQPLIAPLYESKSAIELLALLAGDSKPDALSLVKAEFAKAFGEADLEAKWSKAVHDGVVANTQGAVATPKPAQGELAATANKEGLEIVFCASASVYDGRFANNSWLQETPDPMTKITWDNAALFHPETAREKGIENDTLVRLAVGGRELEMVAYLMPGQPKDSVTVALGYGRGAAGQVGGDVAHGVPTVGFDTYVLRTSKAMHFASGLQVTATGRPYALATTQDHHIVDAVGKASREKRIPEIAREATLQRFLSEPDFAKHAVHHPPLESLWKEWSYEKNKWGMSVDLTKCIGCNACMVACQAENNVPVVGKDLVRKGREMHWIRVDRYFVGDQDTPRIAHQVVACHHCENAPCEQVCPVAATVHSHEGLNDMVYNRCIGTRYCANNCPYKVRRFNYFYYHKDLENPNNEVKKMVFNPDVTVRTRGVMEKCTFCVQRIQAKKIDSKNERRDLRDGEIQTACQQACPAQAIQFGDLGDTRSRVVGEHKKARAYQLLAELNIKPRTAYLAKIRNPHPDLEVADLEEADHEHDRH